jgi:polyisoprenoid-binding protein YceI
MKFAIKRHLRPLLLPLALLSASSTALADWSLSPESTLQFISTKNTNISEVHRFMSLSGSVSSEGKAKVEVDLTSVETGIPIRNERLQSMLFETPTYGTLTITSDLPKALLTALKQGEMVISTLPLTIKLHGETVTTHADVLATTGRDGHVVVTSLGPVLVKADKFSLVKGIEALRDVAKLERISTTVPVTFTLLFAKD